MEQYLKNITSDLVDRLPNGHLYYTPADLKDAGYPTFLVDRIHHELQKNLADSVKLPESDWADMKTDSVQDAWDHFLVAIRAETRIPSSYVKSVTENAVEDVIELLSKPRKSVLETLFRNNEDAQLAELQARRKWVVVNVIMADALIRYAQRKGLDEISRKQASFVISETDRLICAGFTPLKWAQHLEHWFELLGKEIPSVLLRVYFLDKEMRSVARQFESGPDFLTRAQLIEVLSTTDFDYDDEDEMVDEKAGEPEILIADEVVDHDSEVDTIFSKAASFDLDETPELIASDSENTVSELPFDLEDEVSNNDSAGDGNKSDLPFDLDEIDGQPANSENESELPFDLVDDTSIFDSPKKINELDLTADNQNLDQLRSELTINEEQTEDNEVPIWQRFVPEEEAEATQETVDETEDEVITIADLTSVNVEESDVLSIADISSDSNETDTLHSISDISLNDSEVEEWSADEESDDDSFSNTSIHQYQNQYNNDDSIAESSDDDDDDDVIYLSDDAKSLLAYLNNNRDAYIDEIFRGDERAFYTQIGEISTYSNWFMAGKFITRDIFDKNRVDLYSDNAVQFTDSVQEYFEKKEN